MSENYQSQPVSRRNFLRNVTITAVAATAAGAGAAAILGKDDTVTFSTADPAINQLSQLPPPPAVSNAQTAVQVPVDTAESLARLAEAQAENMRLQAELDAALRHIEGLQAGSSADRSNSESLSLQLGEANQQLGILGGLVALYQQLDNVDVTDVMELGLTAVSGSLNELLNHNPNLVNGAALGQIALAEVEEHLPLLENGRFWLDSQLNKVAAFYSNVEFVLQTVLERVGSFLEMVDSWFEDVRGWLPFGLGEKAAQVVGALTELVDEIPRTVDGLQANIAQPLDVWLAREDGVNTRLHNTLIRPMREDVLVHVNEAVARAERLNTTYQEQLAGAAATAVANRNAVRQQIEAYRQQHQI